MMKAGSIGGANVCSEISNKRNTNDIKRKYTQNRGVQQGASHQAAALTDVTSLVRDDEVAAEFSGGVLHNELHIRTGCVLCFEKYLHNELQLEFALVLDALQVQRSGKGLKHLADGSLRIT